jgi:hypothetical protein
MISTPDATKDEVGKILSEWKDISATQRPQFWVISGLYNGKFHAGINPDPIDLARRMDAIAKSDGVGPRKPPAPIIPVEPKVSAELKALLMPNESIQIGKVRLLGEYDLLTQRLLDEKYVMSARETDRHEAISAILLELRK